MKTVNIDLDAFTNNNPIGGPVVSGYSQTPVAGKAHPLTFKERPHTTANFNDESRQTMSMNNDDEEISGSMSDHRMDVGPTSEMPNEYTNVT
jgi:hypothetical protein